MRGSHHGLVAKSGRLARGRIHLRKPLCVRSKPALAKPERTIHFPPRCPSAPASQDSDSLPDASASRSPASSSLQPPSLIHLQAAVLLAPAIVGLFHDPCLAAGLIGRLPVRNCHFDLTKQVHHLLRLVLLPTCHSISLFQCLFFTGSKTAGHSSVVWMLNLCRSHGAVSGDSPRVRPARSAISPEQEPRRSRLENGSQSARDGPALARKRVSIPLTAVVFALRCCSPPFDSEPLHANDSLADVHVYVHVNLRARIHFESSATCAQVCANSCARASLRFPSGCSETQPHVNPTSESTYSLRGTFPTRIETSPESLAGDMRNWEDLGSGSPRSGYRLTGN